MSDLSITATSVAHVSGATLEKGYVAGETITAGQSVYLKSTDSKWYKMQCDGTAEEAGVGVSCGVAVSGGASGQFVVVCTSGDVTLGTGTDGVVYVVSATAGGIAPIADLVSTNKVTILGYGIGSSKITVNPVKTGRAVA